MDKEMVSPGAEKATVVFFSTFKITYFAYAPGLPPARGSAIFKTEADLLLRTLN